MNRAITAIEPLSHSKRDEYLKRLSIEVQPASLEYLEQLHVANLSRFPFENIDILLGKPLSLEPEVLFKKVIEQHRGGICYELNQLFAQLLVCLGFDCYFVAAEVYRADAGNFSPAFSHIAIVVKLSNQKYLLDVGFGDCHVRPLLLSDTRCDEAEFQFECREGHWFLMKEDRDLGWLCKYRFRDESHNIEAFLPRFKSHQNHESASPFTLRFLCSKLIKNGRVTIHNNQRIETLNQAKKIKHIHSSEQLRKILSAEFGCHLSGEECAQLFKRIMGFSLS